MWFTFLVASISHKTAFLKKKKTESESAIDVKKNTLFSLFQYLVQVCILVKVVLGIGTEWRGSAIVKG